MSNISRWGVRDGITLARTVGRYLRDRTSYTAQEFIEAAEKAAQEYPNEWVVFFALGSKYLETSQFARALETHKRCVELKPNDLRSTYALATIYNALTTADLVARREEFLRVTAMLNPPKEVGSFDPDLAQAEMNQLGMVVDTAASQAIRWFERSLTLHPDGSSRQQLLWDLETLFRRFPHLRH